uniref:Uncharacterized protein n=1 Tax=Sus scrofa TaxID=9823 RepID=A0A8D0RD44_PIG
MAAFVLLGLSACGGAGRGGLDPVLPDPPASSSLNNPFMPQTSRLQPKRDPSPVSGEFGGPEGAGSRPGFPTRRAASTLGGLLQGSGRGKGSLG